MDDPAEILKRLIALPSVNPMGKKVDAEAIASTCYESRVTDFLAEQFAGWGIPYERHEVHPATGSAPARENVIARLESERSRPTLMLEVHQDTVPVEGMTVEPFAGETRDGRIWGRGACDVKGAMACILAVVGRLVEERPPDLPNIVVACTVNEEHGFTGAQALAKLWKSGQSKLLPTAPDAIVVSEPTELNVVVAHKGVVRWKCTATGRAAHSSNPSAGVNAIYQMSVILGAIWDYAQTRVQSLGKHPLLGHPTLSVGTIAGGISVNTVPDRCTIEIDRRILPEEDPLEARQKVIDFIQRELPVPAENLIHEDPFIIARGLKDLHNGALAAQLVATAQESGVGSRTVGVPFGTDASAFGSDVPTVVFGPGSIAQAHTKDEWIAVEQLHRATEILRQFCRNFAG